MMQDGKNENLIFTVHGGAIISRVAAIGRLRKLRRLTKRTDEELTRVLRSLWHFDLCFELNEQEQSIYGQEGFMFPALRPLGDLILIPTEEWKVFSSFTSTKGRPDILIRGVQIEERSEFRLNQIFFRLQVYLRPLHDVRFKLYANGTLLRDRETGNRGLITYAKNRIYLVSMGLSPTEILAQMIAALKEIYMRPGDVAVFSPQPLCAKCLQGGVPQYNVMDLETRSCEYKHTCTKEERKQFLYLQSLVEKGVLWLESNNDVTYLWSAKAGSAFYTDGKWQERGSLRFTTLTHEESSLPRKKEFQRVRELFWRFVTKDKVQPYELDKVVFFDNAKLEKPFKENFLRLVHQNVKAAPVLNDTLVSAPPIAGGQMMHSWKQWILQHFDSYAEKTSGNERLNLVAAWHGTSEEVCWKIAENNFIHPNDLPSTQQKDPGFFGKGIYFTQFPSYGAMYAANSPCLLLSWLMMGNVYPVTETPSTSRNDPGSLMGKGAMPGCDSHYALVRGRKPCFVPCKLGETPEFDELVVFNTFQILPRYLIYFHKVATLSKTFVQNGSHFSIWVDPIPSPEVQQIFREVNTGAHAPDLVPVSSVPEMQAWLLNHHARKNKNIRIVINLLPETLRTEASDILIKRYSTLLRSELGLKLKVLFLTADYMDIQYIADKRTFISDDMMRATEFASWSWPAEAALPVIVKKREPQKVLAHRSIAAIMEEIEQEDMQMRDKERRDWKQQIRSKATPTKIEKKKTKDSVISSTPRKTPKVVLWVDDKLSEEDKLVQLIRSVIGPNVVEIILQKSLVNLHTWLSDHGGKYSLENIRIVTNRVRSMDGGENAGRDKMNFKETDFTLSQLSATMTVNSMKNTPWHSLKIMVFCGQPNLIRALEVKGQIFVTGDTKQLSVFTCFQDPM